MPNTVQSMFNAAALMLNYACKQDVIDAANRRGSTAATFGGAVRYLRANPRTYASSFSGGMNAVNWYIRYPNERRVARTVTPLPPGMARYSDNRILDKTGREVSPREAWRIVARRVRWERSMDARAREIMAGGRYLADRRRKAYPLLDRDEYAIAADRVSAALGLPSIQDCETWADSLTQALLAFASAALQDNWPFRRSQSNWAGGGHTVRVRLGVPGASGESDKVWSDNGKWSGSNSRAVIQTDINTLRLFPRLMTSDGLPLCRAEKLGPREYRVTWIEQSKGFDLKAIDGWLVKGVHVRAKTLNLARAKANAARVQRLGVALEQRNKRRKLVSLRGVYMSIEDSIAAGNCEPATKAFASQVWRTVAASGPCAVRADIVLAARDDKYTRGALTVAMRHSG